MNNKTYKEGERYYAHGYNIPTEIKFCKRCVISNQRPRIKFDEEGICSACRWTELKDNKIDWDKREQKLKDLLDKHRKSNGNYDVIVPSSGGKDSGFVAHQLKHIYKMNPLSVTWSPHLYTDIGFKNLRGSIEIGDISNILITPPGAFHRKLANLSLKILGDAFLPFTIGQMNVPMQIAELYNIPLVFYGENNEMEYGQGIKDVELETPEMDWNKRINDTILSGVFPGKFIENGVSIDELLPYLPPNIEKLKKIKLDVQYFGYYKKWIPQENYYYCVENTGFEPNPDRTEGTYTKFASLDDKLDPFHYYLMLIKFGIGRTTSDAAHEVRDGRISREEAVQLVSKYDSEFPKKYYKTFLEYCNISHEEFNEIIDSWRPSHIWRKDNEGNWKLKHTVDKTGTDD